MMQIQQISAWQSIFGSDMGGLMLPQVPGGFDETIPTTTIAQYRKPAFKKPFVPVKKFQVCRWPELHHLWGQLSL